MLKNAFKKHPLQNRTNVQIKGGGVKGLLNNVKKKLHFSYRMASLSLILNFLIIVALVITIYVASFGPHFKEHFNIETCELKVANVAERTS